MLAGEASSGSEDPDMRLAKMEPEEQISPQEMRGWLKREKTLLRRLTERRIQEATAFVDAYAKGAISWGEAEGKWRDYGRRWTSRLCDDEKVVSAVEGEMPGRRHGVRRRK